MAFAHYTSAWTPLFAATFRKLETGFSCSGSEVQRGFQMLSISHKPHPSGEGTIWTDGRLVYQMVLWYVDLKTCCSKDSHNAHKQLCWYYPDVKCKWNHNSKMHAKCKMSMRRGLRFSYPLFHLLKKLKILNYYILPVCVVYSPGSCSYYIAEHFFSCFINGVSIACLVVENQSKPLKQLKVGVLRVPSCNNHGLSAR